MTVSKDIRKKIEKEFDAWTAVQYAGKTKEERKSLGQFFTPPVLSIRMLEKFESVKDKDVLDPTCGAGGLLVAAILAGADPKRVYGIELDPLICQVARKRLSKYGVPAKHIKVGNALDQNSYEDFENYEDNCDELAAQAAKERGSELVPIEVEEPEEDEILEEEPERKVEVKLEKVIKPVEKKTEKKKPVEKKQKEPEKEAKVQKAISITELYGKYNFNEVVLPDIVGKAIKVKTEKRKDLQKAAEVFRQKIEEGYWFVCRKEYEESLNRLFSLNDVDYSIPKDRVLRIDPSEVKKVVEEQMFNSYDDLYKFLG